ncbi:MAG: thioredoxin [Candidatus Komeilibacteria bacterium CG_4_10_14_0_2_um_filter_37_10]|uniref:Thioredoxin n=1 Tax=Candidatus Komeilibacteria bacterium CG_4_10_14_0_2_um_filter_37_10 TaxID=1974470 RepID=A0A2M7VD89_9BACT|nr:MAG: thioredoxin [Candidatus Komeilibacteria bacterium CG_4_10_14_0_2_um_filter_37_10]
MAEHVTDQNFQQEVLQAKIPVFVDFYATWCGPCKMMSPVIDELSKEYEGKIKIVKLDVDANQTTAQQYQVMSIPTMFIFKNGQIVQQLVGYQDKSKLKEKLDNLK